MNPRTKSALLLTLTLLIGMVLGALLNARLAEQRIERIAFLRSSQGFIRFMNRAIVPRDEAQQAAIHAVLERAAMRMADHLYETRTEMRAIIDSTQAELRSILTTEQMNQLEESLRIRQRNGPGPRGRRGPPRP